MEETPAMGMVVVDEEETGEAAGEEDAAEVAAATGVDVWLVTASEGRLAMVEEVNSGTLEVGATGAEEVSAFWSVTGEAEVETGCAEEMAGEVATGVLVSEETAVLTAAPVPALVKVEPMGPNLMLEKMTLELGTWASMSAGTPESVPQEPRAAPGPVALVG